MSDFTEEKTMDPVPLVLLAGLGALGYLLSQKLGLGFFGSSQAGSDKSKAPKDGNQPLPGSPHKSGSFFDALVKSLTAGVRKAAIQKEIDRTAKVGAETFISGWDSFSTLGGLFGDNASVAWGSKPAFDWEGAFLGSGSKRWFTPNEGDRFASSMEAGYSNDPDYIVWRDHSGQSSI